MLHTHSMAGSSENTMGTNLLTFQTVDVMKIRKWLCLPLCIRILSLREIWMKKVWMGEVSRGTMVRSKPQNSNFAKNKNKQISQFLSLFLHQMNKSIFTHSLGSIWQVNEFSDFVCFRTLFNNTWWSFYGIYICRLI